jgi:adenylate cyclase
MYNRQSHLLQRKSVRSNQTETFPMVDRRRKLHQEIVADLPRQYTHMLIAEIPCAGDVECIGHRLAVSSATALRPGLCRAMAGSACPHRKEGGMGVEIERKFLVHGTEWQAGLLGIEYRQGYLNVDPDRTVRVRLAGDQGYLTIKGTSTGASRLEFEYSIPADEAVQLLELLCRKPLIEKIRYRVPHAGQTWDVDEFFGDNRGLVLAEIELDYEGQTFELPPWVGQEVTADTRFYNACLAERPLVCWSEQERPDGLK